VEKDGAVVEDVLASECGFDRVFDLVRSERLFGAVSFENLSDPHRWNSFLTCVMSLESFHVFRSSIEG
jgi:hypothetical protein